MIPEQPQLQFTADFSTLNETLEKLIVKIVMYFMQPENWSGNHIRDVLIPGMIQDSLIFNQGKEINLMHFDHLTLTNVYLLAKIFPQLEQLTLGSEHRYPLDCLARFKHLKTLTLRLDPNGRVNPSPAQLPVKQLNIHADTHAFSIQNILKSAPHIEDFSLEGGFITMHTLGFLKRLKLHSIKLSNIKTNQKMTDAIMHLILGPRIKRLGIFQTRPKQSNMNFGQVTQSLLSRLTKDVKIESLAITLYQGAEKCQNNLGDLRYLKNISIYFTVQDPISSLEEIINILSERRHVQLTCIEYYDNDRHSQDPEYGRTVMERSKQAHKILHTTDTDARIAMIDHSTHFPVNSAEKFPACLDM